MVVNECVVSRKLSIVWSQIMEQHNMCANYGTIRVMQSWFLSSHNMSATSSMSRLRVKSMDRLSSSGGSKFRRDGGHAAHSLRTYRLLCDICTCKDKENNVERMVLPLDSVKYIYASRVALGSKTMFI